MTSPTTQTGKRVSYPAYKLSGIEWVDEIPVDWHAASLRWISKRYAGGTPDRQNPDYWENGTIPWVNSGAVNQWLITEPSALITELGYRESSVRWIPEGALVIALAGQGKTKGMVAQAGFRVCCNQSMAVICPTDRVEPKYLLWWLCSQYPRIRGLAGDSQRDGLNLDIVGSIPCLLPLRHEQKAIAAFLDRETARIDALIEKKQRQIELLKEKRSALISHAVTKGLDPNAPMKDSGIEWLGQIPAHWEVTKFKRCAFFQEGPGLRNWQFTDSGVRVICVTNITEAGIDFDLYQKFISEEEYVAGYKRFTINQGDLLLSSSGNSWGKVAEYVSNDTAILNTSTIRINQLSSLMFLRSFIKWVLQSKGSREQLGLMMTGACQPNFGPSHLSEVVVSMPSLAEQGEMAAFLDRETGRINELVSKVQESIETLREYRTALISAVVTGKIDVRKEVV